MRVQIGAGMTTPRQWLRALLAVWLLPLLILLPLAACKEDIGEFVILSGSENKELEPLVQRFAQAQGVKLRLVYQGSVEISQALHAGKDIAADAVWPANRLWLAMGDTQKVVRHDASIMRSPVILGLRRSLAQGLGWAQRSDLTLAEILKTAQSGAFRYAMTSATQSNSGASFYLAALHAFSGNPSEAVQIQQLDDPGLRAQLRGLLATVNRSSGSSGWLKTLFLEHADQLDGMINYESVIWETNRALTQAGREPLCAIYPSDAVAIADHPLGFVAKGDAAREKFFLALRDHLLSAPVQAQIRAMGRRGGTIGMEADPAVLTAAECFDTKRVISPVPLPQSATISRALALYQTALRKPSATVYVLDFSGSMQGRREADLKAAMTALLEPGEAQKHLLQSAPDDLHVVIPFSDRPLAQWEMQGNDPAALRRLLANITSFPADGATNIYTPIAAGLRRLAELGPQLENYFPAIILMTDGESNSGVGMPALQAALDSLKLKQPIPVFAIAFGEADRRQLQAVTALTSGKLFDSRHGLIAAFKEAKGYN